ncbi:MAG TPA: 30S ribosomal protein S3, partial [Lactobacillus acetotolerans]|nr:30S ribosomal protein S3 [Lactobacillus acetotolerans]
MGQKINPNGFRLGVIRDWESKWYADRGYKDTLNEDLRIRRFISKKLKDASVSTVEIERAANRINISINTSKPGMVIGKGGSEVEALRKQLNALTKKQVHVNIVEIKKPDLDAKLVADGIARQLEARIAFRRAMRQATQRTMRAGAEGIRV